MARNMKPKHASVSVIFINDQW